ncbi:MAG TPA: hypothetical protein VKF36_07125 [Syntrophorhabdales bacterium]|nr:hypothetical protein [Syntrophorhabdales bacterium]
MKRKFVFAYMFCLLLLSYAHAEDDQPFSGNIFLGGRALNSDHQSANLNQYNELGPGLFGGGNVTYDKDKDYFDARGAYLGENDTYLRINGGRWGDFKYSLHFTESPDNLSSGH